MRKLAFFVVLAIPFAASAQSTKTRSHHPACSTAPAASHHPRPGRLVCSGKCRRRKASPPSRPNGAPGKGNHSIGQLAYHIWYWDDRALTQFKGEKPAPFDGNNNETFDNFTPAQWDDLVKKLDQVLTDWEKAVETADDQKLAANASLIAHVGAHNAYHIGQILYVRKLEGVWDPAKGVKY